MKKKKEKEKKKLIEDSSEWYQSKNRFIDYVAEKQVEKTWGEGQK